MTEFDDAVDAFFGSPDVHSPDYGTTGPSRTPQSDLEGTESRAGASVAGVNRE